MTQREQEKPPLAAAFFGGGTGGHLFPGIALAEYIAREVPGARCVFYRSGRPVEDRIFKDVPYEVEALAVDAPAATPVSWLRYSTQTLRAVRALRRSLRGRFDIAIGLGGYVSVPGIIAARTEGVPILLLEQNAVPGKATRLLARAATRIACAFPEAAARLGKRAVVTGNPVRRCVLEAARRRKELRPAIPRITIAGGSQGARGLDRRLMNSLSALRDFREKIEWIHVASPSERRALEDAYRRSGFKARVCGFTPSLPELFASSDLVVTRAGGTVLAELALIGVPAVFVPYPHHRDAHQRANARAFAARGAGWVVEEEELSPERLRPFLEMASRRDPRLEAAGRAMRSLARTKAAESVFEQIVEATRKPCRPVSASFS